MIAPVLKPIRHLTSHPVGAEQDGQGDVQTHPEPALWPKHAVVEDEDECLGKEEHWAVQEAGNEEFL